MARKLDAQQQRELTHFANSLYELAGYTTTAEWARDSEYPASNLSKLRNAKGAIDGYNLLRLIRAAAARIDSSAENLALDLERETDDGSEGSIDSRLRRLSALVLRALELLEAERAPQAEKPDPAVPRKGRKIAE